MQSVKRNAFEDRWDAPFALSIIGVPWLPNPKGSDPKELAEAIVMEPECPEVIAEAPDVASHIKVPRRMYILKPDLDKHGYTQGCPACLKTKVGARTPGAQHTDPCRLRLEAAVASTNPARAKGHKEKTDRQFGERLEKEFESKEESVEPVSSSTQVPVPEAAPAVVPTECPVIVAAAPSSRIAKALRDDVVPTDLEPAPAKRMRRTWDDDTDMQMLIADYHDDCVDEVLLLQEGVQLPVCEDPSFEEIYQGMLDLMHPLNSGSGGGVKMGVVPTEVEVDPYENIKLDFRIDSIAPGRGVYDENTGEILDPTQVKAARALAIEFINKMGVWKIGPGHPKAVPQRLSGVVG